MQQKYSHNHLLSKGLLTRYTRYMMPNVFKQVDMVMIMWLMSFLIDNTYRSGTDSIRDQSSVNTRLHEQKITIDSEIMQKWDHIPLPMHLSLDHRHRTTLCRWQVQKHFVKGEFCILIQVSLKNVTETRIENKSAMLGTRHVTRQCLG